MSQRIVFLTGGSGFIGRRVVAALAASPEITVRALVRRAGQIGDRVSEVVGDLGNSETYRAALRGSDCVVHLAALTGAASDDAHLAVNRDGTRALVEACNAERVEKIVFVSTIAVTYPDLSHYAYGRSKRDAESIVRDSGLEYLILRPTIVVGAGSPIWEKLSGLAALPVMPLLGGGSVRVQPVWVDDVARAVAGAARRSVLPSRAFDLGGPEALTFADFMRRIRRARTGKEGPALPLPLAPVLPIVGAIEKIAGGRSPVTRGQFAAFLFDSAAASDALAEELAPSRMTVNEMIAALSAQPAAAIARPVENDAVLLAEGEQFARYLLGGPVPSSVLDAYVRAHHVSRVSESGCPPTLDRALIALARRGPFWTRAADSYAALFARSGLLRRKLVLLVAILESHGASARAIDTAQPGSTAGWIVDAGVRGAASVLLLALAGIALVPMRLLDRR